MGAFVAALVLSALAIRLDPGSAMPEHEFEEYARLPGGFVAWGDFDQDGDPDLVTGCAGDGIAHIIRNESGSFDEIQALPCGSNTHGNSQPWGDYDGDGDLDLALPLRGASYFYRNEAGTFVADERVSLPTQYSGGAWFRWSDVDGRNGLDLVIVGVNESGVFLNDGFGALTASQALPTRDNHSADLGDFDGDGDEDLVVVGAVPGGGTGAGRFHLEVYENEAGSFHLTVDLGPRAGSVGWVDFDQDGLLDISVVGGFEPGASFVELWRQGPAGNFVLDADQPTLAEMADLGIPGINEGMLAWGDYNRDGLPDLFVSSPTGSGCQTRTLANSPTGSLQQDPSTGLHDTGACYYYPTFGDFDGDGDPDLAAWQDREDTVVFLNEAESQEAESRPVGEDEGGGWWPDLLQIEPLWVASLCGILLCGLVIGGAAVIGVVALRRRRH